jgi:class 3 adenylate cyclase/PAS domain-containing protein
MQHFLMLEFYIFYQMRFLVHRENIIEWGKQTELCESIVEYNSITNGIMKIFDEFDDSETRQFNKSKTTIFLIFIFCSILYLVIFLTILFIFSILSFQELTALSKMALEMNPKHRSKASEYISLRHSESQQEAFHEAVPTKGIKLFGLIVFDIFFILLNLIFILIFYFIINSQNSRINNLSGWMLLNYRRLGQSLRILFDVTLLIDISKEQIKINYIELEFLQQDILKLSDRILQENSFLLGKGHLPSIIGENQEFDKLNIETICDTTKHGNEVVDSYSCSGLMKNYELVVSLSNSILQNYPYESFSTESNWFHIHQIINKYIRLPKSYSINILTNMFSQSIDKFDQVIILFLIFRIIFYFFIFIFFYYLISTIDYYFQGFLQLLRRQSLLNIFSNHKLFSYLIDNRSTHSDFNLYTSIFQKSKDIILCLNQNETVEVVNPAASELLGYSLEQLLGQHISSIFHHAKFQEISSQFEMMTSENSPLFYENHLDIISSLNSFIPVYFILLGVVKKEDDKNKVESFILILKNETVIQSQMRQAENIKEKTEKLLYSILPRCVVDKIRLNENDISFSVQSISVIFINIVQFREYLKVFTPSQVTELLSTVFSKFDSICENFESITKIKIIGDIYMAAGGILSQDPNSSLHPKQVVQFGLDCISSIETLNQHLNGDIQIRIGINTGGPVTAGIIGTDKPIFDIFGDAINLASQLQSSDVPGFIQISQTTYNLIQEQRR